MPRKKSAERRTPHVDFPALVVLIETATRRRIDQQLPEMVPQSLEPIQVGCLKATDGMTAREFISARKTVAKLLTLLKHFK